MKKLILHSASLALLTCAPAIAFAAGGGFDRGHEGRVHHVFWRPPHHHQNNRQHNLILAYVEHFFPIRARPSDPPPSDPPPGDPQPCGGNPRCASPN